MTRVCLSRTQLPEGKVTREFLSLPVVLSLSLNTSRTVLRKSKRERKGEEDLELFLTRSKALGVIRSCLE